MKRALFLLYGAVCYLMFVGIFVYAAAFVFDIVLPHTIDKGPETPTGLALAINLGLLTLFALQHSIMARPTFKRWLTRFVPEPIERSTYVLFSNLAMILLFWQWRPMTGVIWQVQHPVAAGLLYGVCAIGWLGVLISTMMLNHFDLFGLRQVWLYFQRRPYTRLRFGLPLFYRHVRHPLYLGWTLSFWVTPTMTVGHLLFATCTFSYILVAIWFEERNLIEQHGYDYTEYRRRVPKLFPRIGRSARPVTAELTANN